MVDSQAHRELALLTASQSIVLLRNQDLSNASGPLLPLSQEVKLALIGPHVFSTVDMLGNYHGVNLQVLNGSVADIAAKRNLSFAAADGSNLTAAQELASRADVAVLCLGLSDRDEGEGHDRTSLSLPEEQLQLMSQVYTTQY